MFAAVVHYTDRATFDRIPQNFLNIKEELGIKYPLLMIIGCVCFFLLIFFMRNISIGRCVAVLLLLLSC